MTEPKKKYKNKIHIIVKSIHSSIRYESKIKEQHEFLRKIGFGFWCNSKTNVYISIFSTP